MALGQTAISDEGEVQFEIEDNFSIQSSEEGDIDDLDDFLNDVVAKPTAKKVTDKTEPKETPKETPSPKGKEPSEKEKAAKKDKEDAENSFEKLLEEEGSTLAGKKDAEEGGEVDETLQSIAEELYRLNIFTKTEDDEEIPSTPEEFLEKFEEEKQRGAEQIVEELAGRHGEEYRDAFYSIFVDGVHPKDYLGKFAQVQSFKEMDLSEESNQVKCVEASLRKQRWEESDIQEKLRELRQNADLENEAKRCHRALVKHEEEELSGLAEKAKVEQARNEQMDKVYLMNLNNILTKAVKEKEINGIPVTKDVATKAFDMAYNKKWELKNGKEPISDLDRIFLELKKPENHAVKAQIALLFANTFDGFGEGKRLSIDLSNIQKKAESAANKGLFEKVQRTVKHSGFSSSKTNNTLTF